MLENSNLQNFPLFSPKAEFLTVSTFYDTAVPTHISPPKIDPIVSMAQHLEELVQQGKKRHRWMMFVDGENFAIRGQNLIAASGVTLPKRNFKPGVFLWVPGLVPLMPQVFLSDNDLLFPREPERAFYYTSVVADDPGLLSVRLLLRRHDFTPMVFKKDRKDQKAKGVDIALTKDMLMEAVHDHYDVAILLTGDGDYVPVVDEVQRLGKLVIVAFWDGKWVSDELRWRADHFVDLTEGLERALKNSREKGWTD